MLDENELPLDPIDLICRFSPCPNYPRHDPAAVQLLAQALVATAKEFRLDPDAIIDRCAKESSYCPTEYDLRNVAVEIREGIRRDEENRINQRAVWEKEYGKPAPADTAIDMDHVRAVHARRKKLWDALRVKFSVNSHAGKWPSWRVIADAAHELGYEDYARAWGRR